MNLFANLSQAARRHANAGAVFHGTRCHATYAGLHARAGAFGAALRHHTVPGDRVLVAAANCPEYPEILFGIWAAGLVVVPVNAKLHPREFLDHLADSGARVVLASDKLAPCFDDCGAVVIRIGSAAYAAMVDGPALPPVECAPDDLAWLFYTSGTTGRSKGAMLTHRNLQQMALAHVADLEPVEHGDTLLHAAPMSHGSGVCIVPYTMRGARHVVPLSGGFEPDEFLALADHHPGAGAFLAPTMVRRLRLHIEETGRPGHGMRSIVYGGGPMYLDEIRSALKTFGPVMVQLYGQGEAPMTITGLRCHEHVGASDAVLASVGWARSGVEVRVVDADGTDVPPGVIGEIVCRSDIVMKGYWNNPDATSAAIRDGWLYTGDMGEMDGTGLLTLRDRSKDVIISGGTNIYPREIEEVLLTHPDVAEISVVGEPDADWGENVIAFVVFREGVSGRTDDLDAYCIAHLARFKRPKRYVIMQSLPKNNYGKVLKRELSGLLATAGDAGSPLRSFDPAV